MTFKSDNNSVQQSIPVINYKLIIWFIRNISQIRYGGFNRFRLCFSGSIGIKYLSIGYMLIIKKLVFNFKVNLFLVFETRGDLRWLELRGHEILFG